MIDAIKILFCQWFHKKHHKLHAKATYAGLWFVRCDKCGWHFVTKP